MSRNWNGEALINEFSKQLSDVSPAFKSLVETWINDTILDISSRFDWGHYRSQGKKLICAGNEYQSLEVNPPGEFKAELEGSGSLSQGGVYQVLLTYVQSNGVETLSGYESDALTGTDTLNLISLSELPTSNESMVKFRNVYLKKDSSDFLFHSQIDNFITEYEIKTNTTSLITPPDQETIRRIDGNLTVENPNCFIKFKEEEQLKLIVQGSKTTGNPEYFSPVSESLIYLYPIPSIEMEVKFNYYRNPFKLTNSSKKTPDIPAHFKPLLKAGVIACGFEFRERDGYAIKREQYESMLRDTIARHGRTANVEYSIRDVYGDHDGYEVG